MTKPWKPTREQLAAEKEVLGFYVSGHPLARFVSLVESLDVTSTADLGAKSHGARVRLLGATGVEVDVHVRHELEPVGQLHRLLGRARQGHRGGHGTGGPAPPVRACRSVPLATRGCR